MSRTLPLLHDSDSTQTSQPREKYQQIGRGSCGVILCRPIDVYFVAKWEINPRTHTRIGARIHGPMAKRPNPSHDPSIGLANDWRMHETVFKSFQRTPAFTPNLRVPRPLAFVYQHDRMGQAGLAANMPPDQSKPRDILISQRIPPVSVAVWETLINTYSPEPNKVRSLRGLEDRACLIRLYLGKRRPARKHHLQDQELGPSNFFSLRNFKMYFDQMIDLELHISFIAETMADALAVMHWEARIDGRDVEFVLGGVPGDDKTFVSPSYDGWKEVARPGFQEGQWSHTSRISSVIDFRGRRVCMWLLDFNQCHKMAMDGHGVEQAVDAYFVNDPYYPRPPRNLRKARGGALPDADDPAELLQRYEDDENWSKFRDRYLTTSAELLKESTGYQHLPQVFIGKVLEEQMRRYATRTATPSEFVLDDPEPAQQEDDWTVVSSEDLSDEAEVAKLRDDSGQAYSAGKLHSQAHSITREPGVFCTFC